MYDFRLQDADGRIDVDEWRRRVVANISVGRCSCGGSLTPQEPYQDRHLTWLESLCAKCGKLVALPLRPPKAVAAK